MMIRALKTAYHFFGSIYFAILLIATTAAMVTIGTVLEASTDSHRFASQFTYGNPFFTALLWGFFFNILIATLRRWPFRTSHIPFIITHIGLLMILGGCLIKNNYGIQGNMGIMEGGGSDLLWVPDTYVVKVDKRLDIDPSKTASDSYTLGKEFLKGSYLDPDKKVFPGMHVKLIDTSPHSSEKYTSWIKGEFAVISKLNPFPISQGNDTLAVGSKVLISDTDPGPWSLFAIKTDSPQEIAKELFIKNGIVRTSDRITGALFEEIPLAEALQSGLVSMVFDINVENVFIQNETHINAPFNDFQQIPFDVDIVFTPAVVLLQDSFDRITLFSFNDIGTIHTETYSSEKLSSLIAYDEGFGGYTVQFDVPHHSFLCSRENIERAHLHHMTVALRKALEGNPPLSPPLNVLYQECKKSHQDFVEVLAQFLYTWSKSGQWLYPENSPLNGSLEAIFSSFDWSSVSKETREGCEWGCYLLQDLETKWREGADILEALRLHRWPFVDQLESLAGSNLSVLLKTFAEQVFVLADQLPEIESAEKKSPQKNARLLSAYFLAHDLFLSNIIPQASSDEELQGRFKVFFSSQRFIGRVYELLPPLRNLSTDQGATLITYLSPQQKVFSDMVDAYGSAELESIDTITPELLGTLYRRYRPLFAFKEIGEAENEKVIFESAITPNPQSEIPMVKLEDNIPKVTLLVEEGLRKQLLNLRYDRFGAGLMWPSLHGDYRVRFQPKHVELPYSIRLRDARQINYSNSNQPYSYEADVLIINKETGEEIEHTFSMNHVYETVEGYRFYLANISPPTESAVQRVQLVVNYDPAKYYLTYPGAIILALGSLLLFWWKPLSKRFRS